MLNGWLEKLQHLFTGTRAGGSEEGEGTYKPQKKDPLGERGENLAARELRDKGYKIIARNFKCVMGEIDIIARDGKTLVFVEVKTRASDDSVTPEEQINKDLDSKFPNARSKEIVEHNGKKYQLRFSPAVTSVPAGIRI